MKSDGVSATHTGEKLRDKCIELVYDAIASDSGARACLVFISCTHILIPPPATDLIHAKATAIEAAVFASLGGTPAYSTKMRSLFVNLKDRNNPGLREAVASGEIGVDRFVVMTSQASAFPVYSIVIYCIISARQR
jgi:transcription elongation factor S-II